MASLYLSTFHEPYAFERLQKHYFPKTKIKSIIFNCAEQGQNFKTVNFDILKSGVSKNSFLKKLNKSYLEF
jgi:hypothetical protein